MAAVALAAAGSLLLWTSPLSAAQTQPPPGTVSTAVQVAPATATAGTTVAVTGQGFVPTVAYALMLCPPPVCAAGAPVQKCAVPAADNTGNMLCNVDVPQNLPPGDAVVTVRQDMTGTSPAATACPAPLASPVATLPALPAAPVVVPSPPAALPSPPVPLPSPGTSLTGCVREASAILTVLPPPGGETTLPVEPTVLPPLSPDAGTGSQTTIPQSTAAPRPQPVAKPRPAAPPRRVIRPVAAGLPLRSLLPGLLLTALGVLVLAGSLVPGPAAPAPAVPAGGTRLKRFVASMPRRVQEATPPAAGGGLATGGALSGPGRLRSFVRAQGGVAGRVLRALGSLRR